MGILRLVLFLFYSLSLPISWANGEESQGISLKPGDRVSVRAANQLCRVSLTPQTLIHLSPNDYALGTVDSQGRPVRALNTSVGVELADQYTPENLIVSVQRVIAQYGTAPLKGSIIYLTGIQSKHKKEVLKSAQEALKRVLDGTDLKPGDLKIHALTVPTRVFEDQSYRLARKIIDRLIYLFPGINNDYEAPIRSEVKAGLFFSILIEIPNGLYLAHTLPALDAGLSLVSHATILGAYIIFERMMTNWMMRSIFKNSKAKMLEGLAKWYGTGLPFSINYFIFGSFTQILQYYNQNGLEATLARFPEKALLLTMMQGLTPFIQNAFYTIVVVFGIRKWAAELGDAVNSDDARVVQKILLFLPLALDAFFLSQASLAGAQPVLSLGPLHLNLGQIGITGLTAVGSVFYFFPRMLDPALPIYAKLKDGFLSLYKKTQEIVSDFIKDSTNGRIEI